MGKIRSLRRQGKLDRKIIWSREANVHGHCQHLHQFFMYLCRSKPVGKQQSAANQVNCVSKMLYYVQSTNNLPTSVSLPEATLGKHISDFHAFYDRLSNKLDNSGRSICLLPSAMKNELTAVSKYLDFLLFNCSYRTTKPDFHTQLGDVLHTVRRRVRDNQDMIARTEQKRRAAQVLETTVDVRAVMGEFNKPSIVNRLTKIKKTIWERGYR